MSITYLIKRLHKIDISVTFTRNILTTRNDFTKIAYVMTLTLLNDFKKIEYFNVTRHKKWYFNYSLNDFTKIAYVNDTYLIKRFHNRIIQWHLNNFTKTNSLNEFTKIAYVNDTYLIKRLHKIEYNKNTISKMTSQNRKIIITMTTPQKSNKSMTTTKRMQQKNKTVPPISFWQTWGCH